MLGGFYAFTKRREAMAAERVREAIQKERIRSAEEMDTKLRELAEQAARDKDYAVERAVRDALRKSEAARAAAEAAPKAPKEAPAAEAKAKAPTEAKPTKKEGDQ
jgi:hypothetical protein